MNLFKFGWIVYSNPQTILDYKNKLQSKSDASNKKKLSTNYNNRYDEDEDEDEDEESINFDSENANEDEDIWPKFTSKDSFIQYHINKSYSPSKS